MSRLKTAQLKDNFLSKEPQKLYQALIELGKTLPPFPEKWKVEENRVTGCQSLMYLHTELHGRKLIFYAGSDALISAGLAAILLQLLSGETPETILKTPPNLIDELGIAHILTPGRAGGFASLLLKMKQEALKVLTEESAQLFPREESD